MDEWINLGEAPVIQLFTTAVAFAEYIALLSASLANTQVHISL